jgi:hypothetical protein
MAMSRDQRRALRLLAGSPLGVTEAIMLAHGFTNAMLDALVRDGLATAEQRKCGQVVANDGDQPALIGELDKNFGMFCHQERSLRGWWSAQWANAPGNAPSSAAQTAGLLIGLGVQKILRLLAQPFQIIFRHGNPEPQPTLALQLWTSTRIDLILRQLRAPFSF